MTREDVIRMAREAGKYAEAEYQRTWEAGEGASWQSIRDERFATLVAEAEREECAKLCDALEYEHWRAYKSNDPATRRNPHTEGLSDGAGQCASDIRARR